MAKFKIGDKVRVKAWDKMVNEYGVDCDGDIKTKCFFSPLMKCYCEKIYTIKEVRDVSHTAHTVFGEPDAYKLDGIEDWVFDDEMIEPVENYQIKGLRFVNGGTIDFGIDLAKAKFDNERFEKFLDEYCAIGCRTYATEDTLKKIGEKTMILDYEVNETSRIDKTCNKQIPTLTTVVTLNNQAYDGTAVCDKEDYDERQGVLEAIANMVCGGNFDKAYNKAKSAKKKAYAQQCKCESCGKSYDTPEQARDCEKAHIKRKKAKHEKYLMMKEAKKLAREMQIEQMAKELLKEKK